MEVDVGQRVLGGVVALEDSRRFVVGVLRRQRGQFNAPDDVYCATLLIALQSDLLASH